MKKSKKKEFLQNLNKSIKQEFLQNLNKSKKQEFLQNLTKSKKQEFLQNLTKSKILGIPTKVTRIKSNLKVFALINLLFISVIFLKNILHATEYSIYSTLLFYPIIKQIIFLYPMHLSSKIMVKIRVYK